MTWEASLKSSHMPLPHHFVNLLPIYTSIFMSSVRGCLCDISFQTYQY